MRGPGLAVVHDDAVAWLAGIDAGTLKGVFCAQVIEHLPTAELARGSSAAGREALRPGGTSSSRPSTPGPPTPSATTSGPTSAT